jgi:hypothetical protein
VSDDCEHWCLVLRSEPGHEVPVAVRVKRWLKMGLRGFGLRCVEVSETTLPEQITRLQGQVLDLQERLARAERKLVKRERVSPR